MDLFGYEGLAETVTSSLLQKTNVADLDFRFVPYQMEQLEVHRRLRTGCSSPNFRREGEAILTLADLFRKGIGPHWQDQIARQPNLAEKVRWIAEQTTQLTGLSRFGQYLALLFEADMLFGNEDRHLNNIAVLRRGEDFDYCPLFDFGAGLLSNTRDYPLDIEPHTHLRLLRALPLGTTFGRQVQAARAVYGPQLEWDFAAGDIADALDEPLEFYAQRDRADIADRVTICVQMQAEKLQR